MFTGNRGCLVDDEGTVVRHHRSPLWISMRHRVQGLAAPARGPAPVDADLLPRRRRGAGGRPPALRVLPAGCLPVVPGRGEHVGGVREAAARRRSSIGGSSANATAAVGDWTAPLTAWCGRRRIDELPSGTVVVDDDRRAAAGDRRPVARLSRSTDGRRRSIARRNGTVHVLTPPTSVAALANGFTPAAPSERGRSVTRPAHRAIPQMFSWYRWVSVGVVG